MREFPLRNSKRLCLRIGDQVVTIERLRERGRCRGTLARLAFVAPASISVHREEVQRQIDVERNKHE